MKTYRVIWEIDLPAKNHTEAAKRALEIQRNNHPENSATVFLVRQRYPEAKSKQLPHPTIQVDLSES